MGLDDPFKTSRITRRNGHFRSENQVFVDSFALYNEETGGFPLLTKAEELQLAREIKRGREQLQAAIQELKTRESAPGLLTEKEKTALQKKISEAYNRWQNPRERLASSNLRLVDFLAQKYEDRGIPSMDLRQIGREGLMKAVDGYDEEFNRRFSTYAGYWIEEKIKRACR